MGLYTLKSFPIFLLDRVHIARNTIYFIKWWNYQDLQTCSYHGIPKSYFPRQNKSISAMNPILQSLAPGSICFIEKLWPRLVTACKITWEKRNKLAVLHDGVCSLTSDRALERAIVCAIATLARCIDDEEVITGLSFLSPPSTIYVDRLVSIACLWQKEKLIKCDEFNAWMQNE